MPGNDERSGNHDFFRVSLMVIGHLILPVPARRANTYYSIIPHYGGRSYDQKDHLSR